MGFIANIFDKLNNKKYNKLKQEYIDKLQENGYLGSISDIQEYVAKKNIRVMSKAEKYGDEFDIIEEIFSDSPAVLKKIQKNRGSIVLNESGRLNSRLMQENLNPGQTAVDTESYKKFEEIVLHYDSYYNKEKDVIIEDNKDETLKRLERVYKVVDQLNYEDRVAAVDFGVVISSVMKGYSMNKLLNLDNISEQQTILLETQEVLSNVSKNEDFIEFAKSCHIEKIDAFFERIEGVYKLQELGIEVSVEDSRITYIDASNEEKNNTFYKKIDSEKRKMTEKDFDVSSFAMVRTTPYFPKDREMEIIDELNCREYIPNFLSRRFSIEEIEEEFGENWYETIFGENDKEIQKTKIAKENKITKKYETLSPMYRSTKHFTLNGLVSSHMYGDFSDRPYIFIDPLEKHINDEGILSVNEADTYFKATREKPFKLSEKAKLMMPLTEYLKIKDDPEKIKKIHDYELTLFSGDEKIAVDMKLAQMGYMPEDIGSWGYEAGCIMDNAIDKLSKEHGVPVEVHYYSKIKEEDQARTNELTNESNLLFVDRIFEEFGIDEKYKYGAINQTLTDEELDEIISSCGKENLKDFIANFNEQRRNELDLKREEFYANKEKNKANEIGGNE